MLVQHKRCRGAIFFFNSFSVYDRILILPLAFDLHRGLWDGQYAGDLLDRMKHPFVNLNIELFTVERFVLKPWIVDIVSVIFDRETNDEDGDILRLMVRLCRSGLSFERMSLLDF